MTETARIFGAIGRGAGVEMAPPPPLVPLCPTPRQQGGLEAEAAALFPPPAAVGEEGLPAEARGEEFAGQPHGGRRKRAASPPERLLPALLGRAAERQREGSLGVVAEGGGGGRRGGSLDAEREGAGPAEEPEDAKILRDLFDGTGVCLRMCRICFLSPLPLLFFIPGVPLPPSSPPRAFSSPGLSLPSPTLGLQASTVSLTIRP